MGILVNLTKNGLKSRFLIARKKWRELILKGRAIKEDVLLGKSEGKDGLKTARKLVAKLRKEVMIQMMLTKLNGLKESPFQEVVSQVMKALSRIVQVVI